MATWGLLLKWVSADPGYNAQLYRRIKQVYSLWQKLVLASVANFPFHDNCGASELLCNSTI